MVLKCFERLTQSIKCLLCVNLKNAICYVTKSKDMLLHYQLRISLDVGICFEAEKKLSSMIKDRAFGLITNC